MVAEQQKNKIRYEFGTMCEGNPIVPSLEVLSRTVEAPQDTLAAAEDQLYRKTTTLGSYAELAEQLRSLPPSARARVWRLMKPRPQLARSFLVHEMQRLIDGGTNPDLKGIQAAIDRLISLGRRIWRRLPVDLVVLAHVAIGGSSALLCRSNTQNRRMLWLEGVATERGRQIFDSWLLPSVAGEHVVEGARWTTVIDEALLSGSSADGMLVPIGGQLVKIPPMSVYYSDSVGLMDPMGRAGA
jgi:hypothetical protein